MTDFHVEVVRVGPIDKLPNADVLGLTMVGAYPVIVRLGDYEPGQLAVYVPVDAVVPTTDPRFAFLDGKGRIKAKRLRGTFSQGLLVAADPDMVVGQDVAERLGITRYETAQERAENGPNQTGKANKCPSFLPRYTDIENLRRHPDVFAPGEPVIITEKIEGESVAFAYRRFGFWKRLFNRFRGLPQGEVLCRSRNQMKTSGKWFELIDKLDLASRFERLDEPEDYSIYGESYGYTKGFRYGTDGSGSFLVFDVYDREFKDYLDWADAYSVCRAMGLQMVPVMYHGPWNPEVAVQLAEGESVLDSHIKEGVVIRPEGERYDHKLGRVILKLKGQGYLLRKD